MYDQDNHDELINKITNYEKNQTKNLKKWNKAISRPSKLSMQSWIEIWQDRKRKQTSENAMTNKLQMIQIINHNPANIIKNQMIWIQKIKQPPRASCLTTMSSKSEQALKPKPVKVLHSDGPNDWPQKLIYKSINLFAKGLDK